MALPGRPNLRGWPTAPSARAKSVPKPQFSHSPCHPSPDSQRPKSFKCQPDFERHCSSEGKQAFAGWSWHSLGETNVPLSSRGGGVPLHHPRCHLEAAPAGMGTFMVPNGSVNVEKRRPSSSLLPHASHLRCDRGYRLGPKGVRSVFQSGGWQLAALLLQHRCTATAGASIW